MDTVANAIFATMRQFIISSTTAALLTVQDRSCIAAS